MFLYNYLYIVLSSSNVEGRETSIILNVDLEEKGKNLNKRATILKIVRLVVK